MREKETQRDGESGSESVQKDIQEENLSEDVVGTVQQDFPEVVGITTSGHFVGE